MPDQAAAELLGLAERPRLDDWTLRSALVRYAQPEPRRASAVLELIRRVDGALAPHARRLETGDPVEAPVSDLLGVAAQLDALADVMVAWAADTGSPRPDGTVDAVARDVFAALGALGVPRETRPPRRT